MKENIQLKETNNNKTSENQKKLESIINKLTQDMEAEAAKRIKQEELYHTSLREHEETRKQYEQELRNRMEKIEYQKVQLENELEKTKSYVEKESMAREEADKSLIELQSKLAEYEPKGSEKPCKFMNFLGIFIDFFVFLVSRRTLEDLLSSSKAQLDAEMKNKAKMEEATKRLELQHEIVRYSNSLFIINDF